MGRATKWLRRLFGSKRESGERKVPFSDARTEKKRWSFKLGRDSADAAGRIPPANPSPAEAARLRSPYEENEQNKHAIAVAAATTAAAAVQAAVAVARLTSNRGGIIFCSIHELIAAIKIQAFFRGFLARRALRALRALVKLQALIRGFLIRKKAAATLHCMEALIRAQETVRAQKSKSLIIHKSSERSGETKTLKKTSSFHISSSDWSPKFLQISPLPSPLQGSSSTPEWSLPINRSRRSFTAQSTPRFMNSGGGGGGGFPPPSPVINYPNYMSKTRAFEAKDRSQSAPKQRLGKRVPFGELMAEEEQSRASLSRHGIQRSCSQASESFNFRNAVVGRLELNRGTEKDFYFKGK